MNRILCWVRKFRAKGNGLMQCPSKCGEMSVLETPALLMVGLDVEMELSQKYEFPENVPLFSLMPRVCLKCGYYENVQFFTQADFELYSQHRLSLELKENGEIFLIRKPEKPKAEVA